MNIRNYVKQSVQNSPGYLPGEQLSGDYIKLNSNESPYPIPEIILKAVSEKLFGLLQFYPEPRSETLRTVAAKSYGLEPENIIVANGSSELLMLIYRTFVEEDEVVSMPSPGFTLNRKLVSISGGTLKEVSWEEDHQLPTKALLKSNAKIIIVTNPNNPTGTFCPLSEIDALAKAHKGLLVLDEAYVDFAAENGLQLLKTNKNIIILRTFSKSYSAAGIRFGMAFADKEVIRHLMKVQNSYAISRQTELLATAILNNRALFDPVIESIKQQREITATELIKRGFVCAPSQANFLFAKVPEGTKAIDWYNGLKKQQILVRYFDDEILQNFLRITIGTPETMRKLVAGLDAIEV